ncbi:MAG: mycothiol system anti-sigma-R factor [Actinomycetia bacterium]|nr:mycothiol system anti-sigma-R factor [Actinomycetes bacterium]MCP4961877.1 mycothiol system anti-sigma-R factor [Actinomycetes bacterium]
MTSGPFMDDSNPLSREASDCERALDRLYRFLDDYLDESRKAAIKSHLDSCGHCLEAFSFEAELRMVIARRAVTPVPEDLRNRIAEQLRQVDL